MRRQESFATDAEDTARAREPGWGRLSGIASAAAMFQWRELRRRLRPGASAYPECNRQGRRATGAVRRPPGTVS